MIIDSDNYSASGIETLFFPGGEPHAKIPVTLEGNVLLFLKLRTWNDTGIAACVVDALSRNKRIERLDAFIPYFPGARQDRSDGLSPLTVDVMCSLFGVHGPKPKYHIFDPHSVITDECLWPNSILMPGDLDIPLSNDVVGVIAPDLGAVVRATLFRNRFYPNAALIRCAKQRDSMSGRLSNYQVPPLAGSGTYIIVDDICDGGGTFNLLADAFFKSVSGEAHLEMFVSHGIFSKGLVNIDPRIEKITTTDSWCVPWVLEDGKFHRPSNLGEDNRLVVLPLSPLFRKITGRDVP